MFNSPALDTAIGLIFIFLLYSLLATSIKEAIATLFSLRARMLKKGIVEGMLSDTSDDNRWLSIIKGIWKFLVEIFHLVFYKPSSPKNKASLGAQFYDHPLIKNYGSSRIFPTPSYISRDNFSTVLIDTLKQNFSDNLTEIIKYKQNAGQQNTTQQDMESLSDTGKINELLNYYKAFHQSGKILPINFPIIDKETMEILRMHLKNSVYDIKTFTAKIETWFDESMDRVSGWYKRQVQFILFFIGLVLAIAFNVDIIQIAGKLSKDKDARDKMVQMAEQAADRYKDDPRVKSTTPSQGMPPLTPKDKQTIDSVNDSIFITEYRAQIDSAKSLIKNDIANTNNMLAIGWNNFGKNDSIFIHYLRTKSWVDSADASHSDSAFYNNVNNTHFVKLRATYISYLIGYRKFLGFLILAFAVCLGAPFWFDLLGKFINLRGAGKKEDGDGSGNDVTNVNGNPKSPSPDSPGPVTVNLNTQNTGTEAVG